MSKTIFLVLTSAIAIDGEIVRAKSLVEVSKPEAKNLLHRGKARLATAEDGAPIEAATEAEQPADDGEAEQAELSKLKKPQLVQLATTLGIEGAADLKVDDLRAAIEAATEAKKSEAE